MRAAQRGGRPKDATSRSRSRTRWRGRQSRSPRPRGATAALTLLDTMDRAAVAAYQPYWAVRAHLLRHLGRANEARESYDRAIGLTEDPSIRKFLLDRRG